MAVIGPGGDLASSSPSLGLQLSVGVICVTYVSLDNSKINPEGGINTLLLINSYCCFIISFNLS